MSSLNGIIDDLTSGKWINPSNCGLTCKNIRVNLGVQATLDDNKLLNNPKVDKSIDPNFVG